MNEHKKQTKRRKRSQHELLLIDLNGINAHHNNHRNNNHYNSIKDNDRFNPYSISNHIHRSNHNYNHRHHQNKNNNNKHNKNNDDDDNDVNIKDNTSNNENNDDNDDEEDEEDDTPSIRDMQTPINSDIDQESDHTMTENKPLQHNINSNSNSNSNLNINSNINSNINANINVNNGSNNNNIMEKKEMEKEKEKEKIVTEIIKTTIITPTTTTTTPKIATKLKEKEEEKEEEKPSSLRVSFINNKELSCLSYYDRERLSRMKLSLLYIKCCIAVLRPNSPTFPKQNELHRWLDSKNHPPLTRIDIVCTIFLQLTSIAILRLLPYIDYILIVYTETSS